MIATGSPGDASLIRNFTGRQEMDSVASTAMTTLMAFTVRGARKDFTDTEKETAAYPAIVTPKVVGEKGKERGRRIEGGKEEGREKETNRPRETCSTSRTIGNRPDTGLFDQFQPEKKYVFLKCR